MPSKARWKKSANSPIMLNKKNNALGNVVILSGPSGCGKTTLHKALLATSWLRGKLVKSISATTRPRRLDEKEGRDYIFLSPPMFTARIKAGYFLEWEKVFDWHYGTPKRQVLDLLKKGTSVLLCIDVKGTRKIVREFPQALKIFIKTPSLTILRKRLKSRASEDPQSLRRRLKRATDELKEARYYDHVVVNADLRQALRELTQILKKELIQTH